MNHDWYSWMTDPRVNPETDFVVHEPTIIETAVDLSRKLVAYGEIFAKTRADLSRAEEVMKNIASATALKTRREKPMGMETRLTEESVKEYVRNSEGYQAALADVLKAQERHFYAEAWWRAIQKVCDLVQMVGYSRNSEIRRG